MKLWEGIIVHWSASPHSTSVQEIRGWHRAKGWRDIGYHRIIEHESRYPRAFSPTALIKTGRYLNNDLFVSTEEQGAHALGFNRTYLAVCVIASPTAPASDKQKAALVITLETFLDRYQLQKNKVFLHRDVNATECPGDDLSKFVIAWRNN